MLVLKMTALKLTFRFSKEMRISILKRHASGKVRVRFAPSPTGYLHLGGLRTALYNHLFAKSQNGVSILRIEDTDQSRKMDFGTEKLIEDLSWCGIDYDEGPFFQSKRKEIYEKYLKQLIEQGDAYYCFCSNVRLDLLRREAIKAGEVPKYDNKCRHWSKEEVKAKLENEPPPCVRFKLSGYPEAFNDLVYGPITYDVAAEEGDPVIFKNDGFPTYHFANVVDDHLMDISHVLRGVEWQISTTKHLLLYKALKWEPPIYAHLPLLLNSDGSKLSKRRGDAQIRNLREEGILPNAVLNFIVRFGGGFHIEQREKDLKSFTLDELVLKFDLGRIKGSSGKITLSHLGDHNQLEIKRLLESKEGMKTLVKTTQEIVEKHFKDRNDRRNLQLEPRRVELVLQSMKSRITNLRDLVEKNFHFLWVWDSSWTPDDESSLKSVEKFCMELVNSRIDWNEDTLKQFLKTFVESNDLKTSHFMKTLRIIFTGSGVGPSVVEIMDLLGKEDVQFRLMSALKTTADRRQSSAPIVSCDS